MSEQVKKPIGIMETVLRDAHQSLIATRMPTEKMLPIIEKMDKVGYHAVECWGGATFDASLRFLKEDPWERLRKLRDGFKNTKLQMLFRGQNILGYRPYADDVVDYFVEKSIANGIDIIRIFDCLNDLRNLQEAVNATNTVKQREGRGHAQVALSYTLGDAYTLEYWVDMAKKIEEMGADSICIKDMAGLLVPYKATEMISAMKSATKLPIQLHTHYTSGVASMTYLKAVEAGVDVIDCAISPFALGTSQPATEVMVETFKGTPYDTGYDQNVLHPPIQSRRHSPCSRNPFLLPYRLYWFHSHHPCLSRFHFLCFFLLRAIVCSHSCIRHLRDVPGIRPVHCCRSVRCRCILQWYTLPAYQ